MNQFEADSVPTCTDEQRSELAELARGQVALEEEIARRERELLDLQREWRRLSEDVIPAKMRELGFRDFTLADGSAVEVKRTIWAGVTKANLQAAVAWLRDNGAGSLVKNQVTASFGREEDAAATTLTEELEARGLTIERKLSVHAGSLSAHVRELLRDGKSVPAELLGVREEVQTKIVRPTRRRQ